MNDQNPDALIPTGAPAPAPASSSSPSSSSSSSSSETSSGVFAAYDKTLLRFVGGTHDTKAKAKAAAKDKGVTDVEIREV